MHRLRTFMRPTPRVLGQRQQTSSRSLHSAAPSVNYPIWGLSPDGTAYQSLYSIAEKSSEVIQTLHGITGLPWWGTILVTGFTVRAALLPFGVAALRNAAKAAAASDAIRAVMAASDRAWEAASRGLTPQQKGLLRINLMLTAQKGSWAAMRRAGSRPWLSIVLPFLQTPIMAAALLGARHSVLMGDETFEREGLLWFTDLTVPDPYYVVPAAALSLAYLSLEVMVPRRAPQATQGFRQGPVVTSEVFGARLARVVRDVSQVATVVSLPFVAELPAGLFLLMAANSAWTIAYLSAIRHPSVQNKLLADIPLPGGKARGADVDEPADPGSSGTGGAAAAAPAPQPEGGHRAVASHSKAAAPPPGIKLPVATIEAAPTAARRPLARGTHTGTVGAGHASLPVPPIVGRGLRPTEHQGQAAPVMAAPAVAPSPAPAFLSLSPDLLSFAHGLHMHPRFLYHKDDTIDLGQEGKFIGRIQQSFTRKDMPVVGNSPAPYALLVAAGDKRMPWYNSPNPSPAPRPGLPAPIPVEGLEDTGSATHQDVDKTRKWFDKMWQDSIAVPSVGTRPDRRARINPDMFAQPKPQGYDAVDMLARPAPQPAAPVAKPKAEARAGWPRISVDDPLYILLPPVPAVATHAPQAGRGKAVLPHAFVPASGKEHVLSAVPKRGDKQAMGQSSLDTAAQPRREERRGPEPGPPEGSAGCGSDSDHVLIKASNSIKKTWSELLLHLRRT